MALFEELPVVLDDRPPLIALAAYHEPASLREAEACGILRPG